MNLANDVARCDGANIEGEWREGCDACLRRIAPRTDRTVMMEPPLIIVFECEYLI